MEGLNFIYIYNSELTSTITGPTASDPIADGVILYQSTSGDAETTTGETAEFQVSKSKLSSSIQSGAMFYVTNTTANVVISDSTIDFDSTKANLMTIAGNDSNSWGEAGSNGATVTFTALNQKLTGNIEVDTISSLNYYVLQGSTYTGSTSITTNAVNTSTTQSPITVNVDGDSTWIVTGNSTVSNLNVADGAKIVDAEGKTVSIVANGQTVVEGKSQYTITVTGTYSNTVTTSDANALSSSYTDRTDFDNYFGTSTSFSTNGKSDSKTTQSTTASTTAVSSSENKTSLSWISMVAGGLGIAALATVAWTFFKKTRK